MDRQTALLELPTAHAVALRLRDAGAGDGAVAQALGVPEVSVAGLIRIAEAKLAALLEEATSETI